MQQIATQLQSANPIEMLQAMQANGQRGIAAAAGNPVGDPFLQIIQNMIANMQNGEASFGAFLAQQGENTGETDQDPVLMQTAAAMLLLGQQNSALSPELLMQASQGGSGLALSGDSSGLSALQMAMLSKLSGQMENISQLQREAGQQAEIGFPLERGDTAQQEIPVVSVSANRQDNSSPLLLAEQQFRSAVSEAKRQLADAPLAQGEERKIDVDKLQSEMAVFKASEGTQILSQQALEESGLVDAPDLLGQMKEGIDRNLRLAKNEFVIKLRPESLGEITVKLMEKAGKMTLNILTANAQTAKLINGEIAALREAVRPMQVEVQEAVPDVQNNQQGQLAQFDFLGQQASQQQAYYNQEQSPAYYVNLQPGEAASEPDEPAEQISDAALDTYI